MVIVCKKKALKLSAFVGGYQQGSPIFQIENWVEPVIFI
jgi:hypothetical protein